MPNIQGQKKWSDVRLLETHELARGGVNGNLNEQAKALADRTELLMEEKASKQEIVQGVFEFGTYAEFNAAKATLPLNCTVVIGEKNNTGTGAWDTGNNRWNGSTLDKSVFDPVTQANEYTNKKTEKVIRGLSGKNLFNLNASDVALGNRLSAFTGNLVTEPTTNASGFIPVIAGLSYSVSKKSYWCWYSSSKTFISGTDSTDTGQTKTAPSTAAYMRVSVPIADWGLMQVEQSSAPTSYEPYTDVIFLKAESVKDKSLTGEKLVDASVSSVKTDFLIPSKNRFNKASATIGKFISGTTGTLTDNTTYDTSDYISVSPNTQYVSSKSMRFQAFFDLNKNFISGGSNTAATTLTTNANAMFVRISFAHTDIDTMQFERGSVTTAYENYGLTLKQSDNTPIFVVGSVSGWSGKTWATLGDSITYGAHWQKYVIDKHQLTWTNFGISGTKISGSVGDANAMCQDDRINAIPSTTDLITIMGGTNDWAQNVPLGAVDSTDPLTFNGALNTLAQKAFTRWPAKRIAIATTPYGEIVDWSGRAGWTSPAHNSLGLTTNDYAEAIRQFCKRKNIHCIDVALSGGWGIHNITEALGGSTTDHLHPASNSNAAKGIGIVHIKGLKDIEPLQ